MGDAELDFDVLHGDVDVAGGAFAGFELIDNAEDGADRRAIAARADDFLGDGRAAAAGTDTEDVVVLPGVGAAVGADHVDVIAAGRTKSPSAPPS